MSTAYHFKWELRTPAPLLMSASSIKSDENFKLVKLPWRDRSNQNPNFLASCQMLPLSRLAAEKMTHCRWKSLEDTWRLCGVETGGTESYAAPVSALRTQDFLAQVFLKPDAAAAAAAAAVAANSPIKMKIGWKTCCWRYRKVTPPSNKVERPQSSQNCPNHDFLVALTWEQNFPEKTLRRIDPQFH